MIETELERALRICNGNAEAADFLQVWARWCHEIDDVIDGERGAKEDVLKTFALAVCVFSHPFYQRNATALQVAALLVFNLYADSVAWEQSKVKWQADFAHCYRHAGNEMVMAVALICGGIDHMRAIAPEQRETCYKAQNETEAT